MRYLFLLLLPLLLCQEALFPATHHSDYHIGFRVIDPRPNTLFHLKGSEILTSFDYFSNRFKSANYLTGNTLNIREILFKPKHLSYFKNDLIVLVDSNDDSIQIFNLRYSTISKISNGFGFVDECSILVNSFLDNDYIIGYGKTFFSIINMNTKKIIASYNDSSLDIKALNYLPEKRLIVTIAGDSFVAWKIVFDYENEKETIVQNGNLSEQASNCSCSLERISNTPRFFSYYIQENMIRIWDFNNFTNLKNISLANICPTNFDSFKSINGDSVLIICDKTNAYLLNISSENVYYTLTTPSKIVDVILIEEKEGKSVGFLLESGQIDMLFMQENNFTSSEILREKYPYIENINEITYLNFYNYFKYEDKNTSSGLIAVRSNLPDNKTVHIISTYEKTYIKNLTFDEEVRKVSKIGFSDYFLILHGNTIDVYNQSTLEPVWNFTQITIDMVDVLFYGQESYDLIPRNSFIAIYSKQGNESLSLYRSDGELVVKYDLPENCQNIKLFCMMNNLDSWLYFTEDDILVSLKYSLDPGTNMSSIVAQILNEHIDNVTRCKSKFSNYNDNKIEFYNNETLRVSSNANQMNYSNETFSQITPLTLGEFLLYDKANNFSTMMTNNFEKESLELNSMKINQNFRDSILLMNKNFYFTGYFYNDKESFETLFEKKCDELYAVDRLGICLRTDYLDYLDENTLNFVESCPEDSFVITNYLETEKKACRKCGLDIPNCVLCSSAKNCLKCQNDYYQVGSKEQLNEYSHCYSLETLIEIESEIIVNKDRKFERCSTIFPNCQKCNSKICTLCNPYYFLNNLGQCELCTLPKNHLKKAFNGSLTCLKCSEILEKCDECSNTTSCSKCQPNYFLHESEHSCIECNKDLHPDMFPSGSTDGSGSCKLCSSALQHCVLCNSDENHCASCEKNYYLDSNDKCTECLGTNVLSDDSTNKCLLCNSRFPQCEECNLTTNTCQKCQTNFYMDPNNDCVACDLPNSFKEGKSDGTGMCKLCNSTMANCNFCDNSTKCTKCVNNFYLDKNSHCVECKEDSKFAKGNDDGFGSCEDCSSQIENCLKCSGNSSNCDLCAPGLYFIVSHGKCGNCDIEHYPNFYKAGNDDGSGKCNHCSEIMHNCDICEGNTTKCKKCDKMFYIEDDEKCSDCSSEKMIKFGGDEGYGTCSECTDCEVCSNSIADCLWCHNISNSQKICDECFNGFYLTNNQCAKCSEECFSCTKEKNQCLKCGYGYSPEYKNETHCMKCDSDNKILDNNVCHVLFCPCTDMNNSIIEKNDIRFFEINNSLFLSLSDLCVKEENNFATLEPLIYYMLSIETFDFAHFSLDLIKLKLGNIGPENAGFTNFDYEDPEWKMFGIANHTNFTVPVRYNFHYKMKYYCYNDVDHRKEEKFGIIQIKTDNNLGSILKIFMNFQNFTYQNRNPLSLSKIICVLEKMADLNDGKKLITTSHLGEMVTCKNYKRMTRNLKTSNENATFSNPETIIFEVDIDYVQSNDSTSLRIESLLRNHSFVHNFNELLKKEMTSLLIPQIPILTSFELVPENSQDYAALPIINILVIESFNSSATFEFKIRKKTGLVVMGLLMNYVGSRPSFEDLKEDASVSNSNSYAYKQTLLVQANHTYEIQISNLTPNQSYILFYALENLIQTNHSDVTFLKFYQTLEMMSKDEDSILKNYKILILAACGGVILLLIIMIVLYFVFRNVKKKAAAKYNEFISAKDEFIENAVSKSTLEEKET